MNDAALSFVELISTARSSTPATAKSITDKIPASRSFLVVDGPIPSIS